MDEMRLARSMHSFARRLEHEINEARMCLDGTPNLEMCRDRLSNMAAVVEKMHEEANNAP